MTDYEPFVADPAEPAPPQRLARLRGWSTALVAIVLVAALTALWIGARDDQDPSLQVPDQVSEPEG